MFFEYINDNSFLTTVIGVILGWMLTTLTSIRERRIKKEEELKKKQRRQF